MSKDFLLKYLKTDSPSTNEIEAQRVWIDEVNKYCDNLFTDNYGNAVAMLTADEDKYPNAKRVVIDAHCDEISWVVSEITNDGFIKVCRNGGTDNDITPGTSIKIITERLDENNNPIKIKGFFGWIPIHLNDAKVPKKLIESNMFIDIGARNDTEVSDLGIELGNFIVVDREPEIINDEFVVGKSLDDKIGGFILSEVLKRLKTEKIELPYDLYAVNSVQEEVGLRGATMITETIKPDVAICFDVCFDTNTPLIDKKKFGDFKLGDGVVFRRGTDVHINLFRLMKKVATDNKTQHKISISGRSRGGTNTFSYYLSNGGVVSSLLSIPLRYMHTPNEMVSLKDVQIAIDYMVELLKNIEYQHNFKLV